MSEAPMVRFEQPSSPWRLELRKLDDGTLRFIMTMGDGSCLAWCNLTPTEALHLKSQIERAVEGS